MAKREFSSYIQGKAEDPTSAINSASLVRQGKKIGAKASATFAGKALRKRAAVAGKGLGVLFGGPAVIAADLLISDNAGQDQYGRSVDTPKGFKAAEEDKAVADYFTEYGSFPENFDPEGGHNMNAVLDNIEKKLRSEQMANQVRQINGGMAFMQGKTQTGPTPEQVERQKFRYDSMKALTGTTPAFSRELKQRKMVGPSQAVMDQVKRTSRKS